MRLKAIKKISDSVQNSFCKRSVIRFFWYEEQRIGLSYDFELCLEAGVDAVLRNPDAFQKKYRNIKVRFISRFPYGIHYRFEKK